MGNQEIQDGGSKKNAILKSVADLKEKISARAMSHPNIIAIDFTLANLWRRGGGGDLWRGGFPASRST